jgi:NADH dehydrogenase
VEWIAGDVAEPVDWGTALGGVDVVLNLAWYRWGSEERFRRLHAGLRRLLEAAAGSSVRRFLQLSVPPAPAALEKGLPYLAYKRRFDRDLEASGLPYRIVRPTMLFGRGDVLLTVMMREIDRYPFFPMFGDGSYHLSPLAVSDLAYLLRREAEGSSVGTIDVGGPARYEYRQLTDLIFSSLGKSPRYWGMSGRSGLRFAGILQALGSHLLYRYEVEWLLSDLLGLAPYPDLGRPMTRVEPFLTEEAGRRRRAG